MATGLPLALATVAAAALPGVGLASPAQDYMLYCMGCHGAEAQGVPGKGADRWPARCVCYMRSPQDATTYCACRGRRTRCWVMRSWRLCSTGWPRATPRPRMRPPPLSRRPRLRSCVIHPWPTCSPRATRSSPHSPPPAPHLRRSIDEAPSPSRHPRAHPCRRRTAKAPCGRRNLRTSCCGTQRSTPWTRPRAWPRRWRSGMAALVFVGSAADVQAFIGPATHVEYAGGKPGAARTGGCAHPPAGYRRPRRVHAG